MSPVPLGHFKCDQRGGLSLFSAAVGRLIIFVATVSRLIIFVATVSRQYILFLKLLFHFENTYFGKGSDLVVSRVISY